MLAAFVVLAATIATFPPLTGADQSADNLAYELARTKAGADADAHVRLALWCEARGLDAERLRHLAIAVLIDPSHATARGLLGLVADGTKWRRPEQFKAIGETESATANLATYNARRSRLPETADAHWELARWCEKKGLKAEARAHFVVVTRLDPRREDAWRKLGCTFHHGRWMTREQIAVEISEHEAQRDADHHWQTKLETWKGWLNQGGKRLFAEVALASVSDPRAVPSIRRVFENRREADVIRAIKLLEQIHSPDASRALAELAVTAKFPDVRRAAASVLPQRDPREVVEPLIALMRHPVEYDAKPVRGPGTQGSLEFADSQSNVKRVYTPPALPPFRLRPGDQIDRDAFGLPVVTRMTGTVEIPDAQSSVMRAIVATGVEIPIGRMVRETEMAAASAQKQLARDTSAFGSIAARVYGHNARIAQLLNELTGQNLGNEGPERWRVWWADQQGYSYKPATPTPKPTIEHRVALGYQPVSGPSRVLGPILGYSMSHSCFGAGTVVRTVAGDEPIEHLRVGDQVLTQNTTNGALSFEPIVAVHHNPPNQTVRVAVGEETIIATPIHRFWRAGEGWVMARELQPGDLVRRIDGVARVSSVEPGDAQLVFNLEVARGESFFVGRRGLLVHDNSLVAPTPSPFDARPALSGENSVDDGRTPSR
jgi:hypothetical protein